LETAAGKNVAYFGVAARLLNQSVELPPELVDLVDAEVALINAGSGIASSRSGTTPHCLRMKPCWKITPSIFHAGITHATKPYNPISRR
jgi:hypothetical protein